MAGDCLVLDAQAPSKVGGYPQAEIDDAHQYFYPGFLALLDLGTSLPVLFYFSTPALLIDRSRVEVITEQLIR